MRRFIWAFVSCALLASYIPTTAHADGAYYLLSAYYSPLEGQDFYLHGSYTDEIKMNGQGKTTSSGAPVRIGAIAAPREIAYNTRVHINQKITIKGVAYDFEFHGTVLDRGGAIHSASNLPRLDIYMGQGQEGLCRAINFGVQTVYVEFDNNGSIPDTTSLVNIPSNCNNPHNETISLASGSAATFDPFTMTINSKSPASNVEAVQKLLARVGAYAGTIDGVFDNELIDAIYNFQLSNGIVQSRSDEGAGNYGPKTRAMLKALLSGELNKTTNETIINTPTEVVPTIDTDTTEDGDQVEIPDTNLTAEQSITELGDVRTLQEKLKEIGYFSYDIDGIYNKRLVDSIYAFQLAKNIVSGESDPGAGYYGPVTRAAIEESYTSFIARKAQIAELEKSLDAEKEKIATDQVAKKAEFQAMINKIPQAKLGDVHAEIRTLQKLLKELGFMDHVDTAIFWPITKEALAKYQLELGMIDSLSSQFAGVLWSRTKEAIANDLYIRWLAKNPTNNTEIERIQKEIENLKKV